MNHQYQTQKGYQDKTAVKDIPLDPPDGESGERTRRIVRAELVVNKKDATKPVKITVLHQRRHTSKEVWQDVESFNQATMKAGQEVRMSFSCSQTYELYEILSHLHTLTSKGLPAGGKTFEVVDKDEATIVRDQKARRTLDTLIAEQGDDLWAILDDLKPGLLQAVALRKMYDDRKKSVEKFREKIVDPSTKEIQWQKFFEQNEWIFGHGLDYRYLNTLQPQANLGGTELDGKGAVRGDFLMATKAQVGFTVLVDIKTPSTPLLGTEQYRNKAWSLGKELVGGMAQVQAQCSLWADEGARQPNNQERLLTQGIFTCEPQGILIIGDTAQLQGDPDKRNTFERFRRSLHNPHIITFDELLQRAEFMVSQMASTSSAPVITTP